MKIRSVACGISNAHGRKSRYRDTGSTLLCCAVVSAGSPAAGRALHAACWLLGALEEAVRTCAHAVRGAFCPRGEMVLTARGEAAWITRGEIAQTARGETRDGDRRGNGQQPCGRGPRGAIAIAGPLGSVPGRASIILVFPWVGREAMALSFAVKCAFSAFVCTAHRVCALSACLLQRAQ